MLIIACVKSSSGETIWEWFVLAVYVVTLVTHLFDPNCLKIKDYKVHTKHPVIELDITISYPLFQNVVLNTK